jgi:outer membrane protein TolC
MEGGEKKMKPYSETVLSIPSRLQPVYLLCLCLLLPGCGLWGYFSSDQEPIPVSRSDSTSHSATATRDGIGDSSDLAELEIFLLQQSPALDPFKESQGSREAGQVESWLPGARVLDSAAIEGDRGTHLPRTPLPGDRSVAIDWRPSSLFDGDAQQRQRDARQSIGQARLQQAQGKLLRLLREEWAELWYQQQASHLTMAALTDLNADLNADLKQKISDSSEESSAEGSIQRVALRSRWNDRLEGFGEEVVRTQIRINALLGRSAGSILPQPMDSGDLRFGEVDGLSDRRLHHRRLHPRVLLAEEELVLASAQLEQEQGSDWPELVIGASSSYDVDASVAGSAGRGDAWMVTLGVEFPLGLQPGEQRLNAAQNQLGSARARQILSRRSIDDEIAAARAQLLASHEAIDTLENQVIAHIEEARAKWSAVATADQGESRLRIVEKLLDARIGWLRAVSDRARARVSLIDLLGLERHGFRGVISHLR